MDVERAARAGLVVERAQETDWQRVRAVRLAALAESPRAFGATLAQAREYDDADWRAWCRGTAVFLAVQDGVAIGLAAGAPATSRDERRLIAMWLHPAHRGGGASTALLTAVRSWALRDGATTLLLWVTRGNQAASRLYRRAGFSATGACKPLPSDPALIEDELALDLR